MKLHQKEVSKTVRKDLSNTISSKIKVSTKSLQSSYAVQIKHLYSNTSASHY